MWDQHGLLCLELIGKKDSEEDCVMCEYVLCLVLCLVLSKFMLAVFNSTLNEQFRRRGDLPFPAETGEPLGTSHSYSCSMRGLVGFVS